LTYSLELSGIRVDTKLFLMSYKFIRALLLRSYTLNDKEESIMVFISRIGRNFSPGYTLKSVIGTIFWIGPDS